MAFQQDKKLLEQKLTKTRFADSIFGVSIQGEGPIKRMFLLSYRWTMIERAFWIHEVSHLKKILHQHLVTCLCTISSWTDDYILLSSWKHHHLRKESSNHTRRKQSNNQVWDGSQKEVEAYRHPKNCTLEDNSKGWDVQWKGKERTGRMCLTICGKSSN